MTSEPVQRKIAHMFRTLDLDGNGFLEQADFDRLVEGYARMFEVATFEQRLTRLKGEQNSPGAPQT